MDEQCDPISKPWGKSKERISSFDSHLPRRTKALNGMGAQMDDIGEDESSLVEQGSPIQATRRGIVSQLEEFLMDKVEVHGELKREFNGKIAQVGEIPEFVAMP
ncbi:hypothetical protein IEQ34_022652 [Dendrobium chrysotoxum]|uniref:Uncharacterized protein n=1 Tax=Dendrobium chrysotoxum TaxID=161865 RepID=A0AAV7FZM7_DENCH|nr:hypothetical protein IEQ34_022652 [Dendrobium chrysotoxum]